MLIFTPGKRTGEGKLRLEVFDSLGDAKTGRWCKAPEFPDGCECFNPETFLHGVATHYVREDGYRHGACENCAKERWAGKHLYRIPKKANNG